MKKVTLITAVIFALTLVATAQKPQKHYVGEKWGGGVVFSITPDSLHGLVAAPLDQSTGIQWGDGRPFALNAPEIGTEGVAYGKGNSNTNAIVSALKEGNYAAKLCYDLVLNGYSDWYLPSRDELFKLFINKSVVGGFSNKDYWSSSEFDGNDVWSLNFTNGGESLLFKNYKEHVRAVRSF